MIEHQIRPQKPGERLSKQDQLAWKIAKVAADQAPLDPKAADMAAMRIIDDWAVAIAALDRPSVCLLYTSPSPRDKRQSRMPSSA